jgi:hypothetical protein
MSADLGLRVAEALNGGPDELMRKALELRGSPVRGPASWWSDRLGLLKRLVLAPWRVRRKAVPLKNAVVVFDVGLDDDYRLHRREFVRRHFAEDVDFVSSATPHISRDAARLWWHWYAFGLGVALKALFDLSDRRYFWLGSLLLEVQAVALASPGIRKAYVFRMFDRRPYLIATFLSRRTAAEVLCVFQNIPLWRNCRYFHIGAPVVLTSLVNLPEVEYLSERGMFLTPETLYRSQEFVGSIPERRAPIVDIGFFSSGEWARLDGLYQVSDAEEAAAGRYADNPYARKADWLVRDLAAYAKENGRTLRIYPHPYERRLKRDRGVRLPYEDLVDGSRVTLDAEGADSRAKIYEPRAAVSLQSSFIWERLDLELEASFIFSFGNPELDAFNVDSLGRYEANVFSDTAQLRSLLDEVFVRKAS